MIRFSTVLPLALLVLCVAFPATAASQTPDTVRFTPTVVQPTFAVREPVLTIKPGTVLISETHWGEYFSPGGVPFRVR